MKRESSHVCISHRKQDSKNIPESKNRIHSSASIASKQVNNFRSHTNQYLYKFYTAVKYLQLTSPETRDIRSEPKLVVKITHHKPTARRKGVCKLEIFISACLHYTVILRFRNLLTKMSRNNC